LNVASSWIECSEQLPLNARLVRYEDTVNDFESQMRGVLEFLELPWRDELVDLKSRTSTQHRVGTPSYHQIAQPIHKKSAGKWQRYREYFEPFRDQLNPFVERFGYQWDE
jgi:hypothetical protein